MIFFLTRVSMFPWHVDIGDHLALGCGLVVHDYVTTELAPWLAPTVGTSIYRVICSLAIYTSTVSLVYGYYRRFVSNFLSYIVPLVYRLVRRARVINRS